MSNYELEIDLRRFIIEHLALPENSKFERDSILLDYLDSLDMVDTIFLVEDRYNITIENVHSIETFGNLLDIIECKLQVELY